MKKIDDNRTIYYTIILVPTLATLYRCIAM